MKLFFYKKIVVIVLVIAMILTTGGFVTLADSILDVIESNESVLNNSDGLSNKYYKEMLNENIDENIEEEVTHIVNQDAKNEEESHAVNQDAENEEESPAVNQDAESEEESNITYSKDDVINTVNSDEESETHRAYIDDDVEINIASMSDSEEDNLSYIDNEEEIEEELEEDIDNENETNIDVNTEVVSSDLETETSHIIEEQEENINEFEKSLELAKVTAITQTKEIISSESDAKNDNESEENEKHEDIVATNSDVKIEDKEEEATVSELQEVSQATLSELKIVNNSNLLGDGNILPSYIWLGTYPQSSTDYDVVEPIKWIVLNDDNNQKYLLSEKILTHRPIAPADDFAASPLKGWLNGDFYNKAFETFEKSAIVDTHITDAGDTTCKIFLLSRNEHDNYNVRSYNVNSKAPKTTYSGDASSLISSTNPYWLRYIASYGIKPYIYGDGGFDTTTDWSGMVSYGVRPTMNIDVTNVLLNANESNVTWQLGEDASFIEDSTWIEWDKYREGYEQKLPTTGNFSTKPDGKELFSWLIKYGINAIATSSIPDTVRGDITLKPIWGTPSQKFIIYDLRNEANGELGTFLTDPPYLYTPGTALSLPDPSTVVDPSGNVAIGWQINGVDVTEIPSTETSDVQVKAVFSTDTGHSKLSFDLGVGHFVDGFSTPSEYERGVTFALPLSTSVVTPITHNFSHWMLKDIYGNIINENATEISSSQTGYIKVVAVYNNAVFNINWELGVDVSFRPDYIASTSYTYNVGLTLPGASVLNLPAGKGFLGWNIRQAGKPDILNALVIEPSSIGDVTIVAHYDDEYFDINWDLGQGHFIVGFATPSSYRAGSGQALPTSDKVVTASVKLFDHWEINGVETTSIPVTSQGTITVVAKYKYDDLWFGTYPQNDTSGNQYEPIRWKIVTQNENEALLIPEKIIDDQAYHNTSNDITWENCSIRSWLNNTFITGAFTSNQISTIIEKTIHTTGAQGYPDSDTLEKVFLLSTSEIDGYSGIMGSVTAQATEYAKAKNDSALKVRDGNSPWWLRNLYHSREAYIVDYNGYLPWIYAPVYNKYYGGVRPVFYINLQSPTFQNTSNNVSWDGDNLFNEDSILWESFDKYFGGQKLPTAENMRDRKGSTFLGWRINNSTILYDEIPMTQTGDITLTPVWVAPVTWRLGHNATFSEINLATPSYNVGIGFDLPDASKVISTRTFDHWAIVQNGVIIDDNVTCISESIEGAIEIVAVYTDSEYTITWDMGSLSFIPGYIASTSYIYGVGYSLPDVSKINLPPGCEFNYWIIKQTGVPDITNATNISVDTYGDVEIEANYSETFWFGTYPQNDSSGAQLEPIKWKVLSKNDDEALLIADNILDSVPYHTELENTTWATSSIRAWLDTTFKTKAFTENQINSGIVNKTISTQYSSDTTDQVFLLSRDDPNTYFSYDEDKKATASTYAKTINTNLSVVDGYSPWWLRSRGGSGDRGTYIDEGGQLRAGEYVNSDFVGVRPVIAINLSSSIIKTSNNHISFNLNGATWKENSKLWQEMDGYQGGQKLPTLLNLSMPKRKIFTGWTLSDDPDNIITEIPVGQTGDIVLEANFIDCYDIFFGTYPQSVTWQSDGSTYDVVEPIKWNMLSYNGSEAFLISDKILDNVTYDSSFYEWSGSHIQYWLYSIFYDKAFLFDEERAGVKTTRVETPGSSDTDDDVFLLSKDEVENELYFSNADERKAAGTQYAKTVVNDSHTLDVESNGCSYYWLRQAPGGVGGNPFIYVVQPDGQIDTELVYNKIFGVRPAITVDLSSPIFTATESTINWQIGSDASFLPDSTWEEIDFYREGFVNKLPTDGNFSTRPDGKVLIGWLIDNGTYKVATYSIPETMRGDITLKPLWGTTGQKLINYNLYNATASEYARFLSEPAYVYTPGTAFTLPNVSNVVDPSGNNISSWQIDGVDATEIPATATSDIEVKAVFNDTGTYRIEFDMGDGHLTITPPSEYTSGVELPLPVSTSVVAPIGREFSHWMLKGANGNVISYNTATISETQRGYVKVVAVYTNKTYTINYDNVISGAIIDNTSFERTYGSTATTLDTPTKDNYTFVAWYRDYDSITHIYSNEYSGNDDIYVDGANSYTIYAKWKAKVTYNVNGHGTLPAGTAENIDVNLWDTTILPTLTNVVGYTFNLTNSWYDNAGCTGTSVGAAGSSYTVTEPKELFAKWNENTYNIIYNENGGTFVSGYNKPESRLYHEEVTLPTGDKITKDGYDFAGWYDNSDFMGNALTSIGSNVATDKVLFAKWTVKNYEVNLITNGGTINDGDVIEYTYGIGAALPVDVTRDGYVFKGWWTGDGTTSWGEQVTEISATDTGVKTFYARWAIAHRVTFNLTSGSIHPETSAISNAPADVQNVEDGNKVIEPMINPSAANFVFDNWYADSSFTTVYDFDTVVTGPITIYAKWIDATTYEVAFNLVSGNVHPIEYNIYDVPDSQHIVSGNKAFKPVEPSTEGFEFINWYTDNTFTTVYDFNTVIIGNTTIYAKWEMHEFTLTFDTKGGEFVDGYTAPTSYNVTNAADIILPTSEKILRSHFVFEGWYRTSDYIDAVVDDLIGFVGNVTLYAKWRFEPGSVAYHTINFVSGGGEGFMSSQYALENEDTILSKNLFTKGGYEFEKWSSSDGRTFTDGQNIGIVLNDLILTAIWKKLPEPVPVKRLTGISIKTKPNILTYTVGNKLNPKGLVIILKYSDNTEEEVTYSSENKNLFTFEPSLDTKLTKDHSVVTVTYKGKSATYGITVKSKSSDDDRDSGGSSSGSGGSSGIGPISNNNQVPNTIYINQIKSIKAVVMTDQISWEYKPIENKYKMNITIGDTTISAENGFYLLVGTVNQNVNGVMKQIETTSTYYFDATGNMVTGWINTVDGHWYFMKNTKDMTEGQLVVLGWYQIQNKWYYFTADGSMLVNSITPDNYFVGVDGAWVQ